MILLRVFFNFGIEVLEGFETWFLQSFCTFESSPLNALGRLLFIGVWGWVSDTWRNLIGDTVTTWLVCLCHRLHVLDRLCHRLHVLDRPCHRLNALDYLYHCLHALRCLCHCLHVLRCDWFLHDTWQISVGFWVVIAKASSNMWCFVIGCILWTW